MTNDFLLNFLGGSDAPPVPARPDMPTDAAQAGHEPSGPARLIDPVASARLGLKAEAPRRFYRDVTIDKRESGYALLLDSRPALTRSGRPLLAASEAAARLIAAEWSGQGERILPATMPVTRILHAAIDHVAEAMAAVGDDVLAYAASDLVCYRAEGPARLVECESRHWDPVLRHAEIAYGARFVLCQGIVFVEQPAASIAALRPVIARHAAAALGALHVLTTISGSALIAIAIADGALSAEAGFDAGEVDHDFEISVWGADDEALARRAARRVDFIGAAALLGALQGG